MEADFPQSAREAEEHIRQIRRDKSLGDGPEQIGNNASDLGSALKLLSHDLYQTATHFLLELIQNADDNSYTAEVPTLSIAYSSGRVRIDCNERGFNKKNIEAICRICQSTKSGRSKSAGFVGEKGIGFKAVFKVASTVWISSGHYSFRFDRDAHLGMIAPIWDKFPEKPREGCTSILLKLAKDCDEKRIINELQSYDEKILLFLRRLRRLEIDVKPGIISLSKPFKTILSRHGQASENPSMMALMNNGVRRHYFVWRHSANKLPAESRRPGISSSEIVLAFPNTGINGDLPVHPVIESQNVYAFLPIRDGGLPFLLQADFLLPADREDVHVDSIWNKALAAAAAIAYIDAVRHMGNFNNSLRYSWIRYIPTAGANTGFFEDLRQDILERLRNSQILDSQSGRKKKPASLIMVPTAWRDPSGRPFMIHRSNEDKFLAGKYDKEKDWHYLDVLGVKLMDEYVFHDEMAKVLRGNPASFFQNKTKEWHASFARTLFAMNKSPGSSELPIIPLRNGKWVGSRLGGGFNYFPNSKSASAIPEGIEMNIVDPEAAADPDRRKLFVHMGVQDLADSHIRATIRNTHLDSKFKPDGLRPDVLVSHAEFLFRTRRKDDQESIRIWMAADLGFCRKSDTMYLPSDVPGAASNILPKGAHQKYGFLHTAYLKAGGSDKKLWFDYLQKHHKVSVYPRLFNDSPNKKYRCLPEEHVHDDFKLILQGSLSQRCLILLREGWEFYKPWLDTVIPVARSHDRAELLAYLREREVRCTGSVQSERVRHTYMPLDRLTREYGTIAPFLDIPDPQNPRWEPLLKCLLVGMEDDIGFYLKCLSGAKKNDRISSGKIRNIMHEIEDRVGGNDSLLLVRDTIARERLTYIPPRRKDEGERGSWVSQSDCFWRGESWLTQSIGLERLYPDLETLFRNHLLVPNAGIEHLIREAAAISRLAQPVVPRIEKLFLAFTAHVKARGLNADQKARIQELEMFPIVSTPENESYEHLTSVTSKKPWLIADRANFRTQFQLVMPVLAFSAEFVLKIKRFLEALDLKDRFLSDLATSITEAHGDVKLHKELTQRYRTRSKYLFRLMPENQTDEKQLREKFRGVDVYMASKIVQYWRAPLGLRQAHSTLAEGAAFLECDYAGDLRIYLRAGYENEAYPYELAEQLRNFFNVPIEHRDLLTMALIAPEERVDQLFEARGIAPLLEEGIVGEEHGEEDATYAPVHYRPGPSKKSRSRLGSDLRFSRLLSHTRFSPSFFKQTNSSSNSPPSYNAAVARATQNAIGRPAEPRTFASALTLPSLKGSLKELEFVQKHGAVVGTPKSPPTILDRVRGLAQRDADIGEIIVSDILAAVLGAQYDRARMWTPRDQRKNDRAAFNFTDTQGRFSAFLMRLDGMSGKAQGYTRLIYHLDVKTTDTQIFKITQDELDRARETSVHSQPDSEEQAPSKHVSVLVHISDVRKEPKIRFLADPWDLFEDGQLILENTRTYQARLNLRLRQPTNSAGNGDAGFDSVQIKPHRDLDKDDPRPEYEKGKPAEKRPEMREVDSGVSMESGKGMTGVKLAQGTTQTVG